MPLQTPTGTTEINVPGLGVAKGRVYADGVRQFCGIPYADLPKRWTRATLNTAWKDGYHDGTVLGCAAPNPTPYQGDVFLIPIEHGFEVPVEDELRCLNINITVPPASSATSGPLPVLVYIHGGSFLFGGAQRPVYDGVNFVSHSVATGSPVIAVSFNYRVGLGGFLASRSIKDELAKDGFEGVGNFGLTDQHTALQWVQRNIAAFGGDADNVTLYGESAGGMSVDHQLQAARPAKFNRAIIMSGLINTIPLWSLDLHEQQYQALLQFLKIDPQEPQALESLRQVPQQVIANAALEVAGVIGTTGNPCDDGWFHAATPTCNSIGPKPAFIQSLMVGDVYHEGMIFHETISQDSFDHIHSVLTKHIKDADKVNKLCALYGLSPQLPPPFVPLVVEDMAGDALFKIQNYLDLARSKTGKSYGYHFDQLSALDNPVKGLAYHALDLLYLFLNMEEKMTPAQWSLSQKMATAWIDFAYGRDPWDEYSAEKKWMVFGRDDKSAVKTETEDNAVRRYDRMETILELGILEEFVAAIDDIGQKRHLLGKFEGLPPPPPGMQV